MNKFVSIVFASIFISSSWAFTSCTSCTGTTIGNRALNTVWGSKWDNLVDEDEDLRVSFSSLSVSSVIHLSFFGLHFIHLRQRPFQEGPPVPRDMKYILYNIDRQRNNFEAMKAIVGKDLMNDVYARDGDTDTFWFVGKVTRVSGACTISYIQFMHTFCK
jgi:hypothetical protein